MNKIECKGIKDKHKCHDDAECLHHHEGNKTKGQKKDLHEPDNHDGVINDLEPDILECEINWALESTPGLPVHHQLPELTQTHVHWVSDAIQPPHPLSSPSPPAFNPSQHQGLFQVVSS